MGRSKSYSNQENQRGQNRNKMTRQEKVQQGTRRIIKDKFLEERQPEPIVAKTDKQKEYLKMLNDPNIQVICCLGLRGGFVKDIAIALMKDGKLKGKS